MKLTYKIMSGLFVTATFLFAFNASAFEKAGEGELHKAMSILNYHADNCSAGARGWWLKLDSQTVYHSANGGISSQTGKYWGCGTCGECRTSLNNQINNTISGLKKYCTDRGGVTKGENRGKTTENVKETVWELNVQGVTIDCQKWVDC